MSIGLDTGFFVRLLQGERAAVNVWEQITRRGASAAISCVTLYERQKLGLWGVVEKQSADVLGEELPILCQVVWLTEPMLLRRAAHVADGNGLAMADAIILISLLEVKVAVIYTTDRALMRYGAGPEIRRV